MEKQKKVERWSYPFKAKGEGGAASTEVIDPQVYYDALAKAESGYYPVSSNGLWHGGVHFDQNTAAMLDQSSVRCIADGVVVAYRIDESYKKLTYTGGGTPKEVTYSTGFVLVKHRLELPPAPAATPPAGGSPAPATPPAPEPDLTFYSLYMHLKDWQGYQDHPELERPAFWAGDARIVKHSAPDKLAGLRVRATANGTLLGVLPRGTIVEAGAPDPGANPSWLKFIRATPAVAGLTENTGFLHKGPDNGSILKSQGGGKYIVNHKADDPITPPQKGANIRAEANSNSTILGLLPAGAQVRIVPTAATGNYHKLLAITDGSTTPAVSAEQLTTEGYVWVKDLESVKEPQARGRVFLVDPPIPIQAGALIGHLGKYQAASQAEAHDLLHLEVFSCDDVETFIAQSRARANLLKPEQKTLLKIHSETQVITREDASQTNPPQVSDPGKPTAYDIIVPLAVLNALPADRKITVTTTTGGTTSIEQWWKLDRLPGKDGNEFSGWVKEQELMTPRLHPWDWDGFDFIKEKGTPDAAYLCKLSADGVLDDGEKTNYQAQINEWDDGPLATRLYEIIDVKEKDGKLTPEEIRDALSKPWHAQSISRLISQYESEWHADEGLSKWQALDCHMKKNNEDDWESEKTRIHSLIWWGELSGKQELNNSTLWHLHLNGLLSTFKGRRHPIIKIDGEYVELEFLEIYQDGELTDEELISAASELNCEPGLIYAIAKQESAHSSFISTDGETIPAILYERHQFKKKVQNPEYSISHPVIYGSAYKRAKKNSAGQYIDNATQAVISINDAYGPTGIFQYRRLMEAYRLNADAALQACSWGKFQIMGFNYSSAGFNSVQEFTAAMSLSDSEHIKAFLKFAKSNTKLSQGLREKNFELIAEGHNGANWQSINPDYATNIEAFYNEYNSTH